jgi:hypothetical protein
VRDDLEKDELDQNEQRGNWYLLTGLVIGLVLGVLYSWVISPVQYIDTDPSSLAAQYKDEYRRVIALAYGANRNLERARERLALMDSGDQIQALAAQAQRMVAENQPPNEARMLAILAADLGSGSQVSAPSPQSVAEQPTEVVTQNVSIPTEAATLEVAAAIQTPTVFIPTQTPTATRTPIPTFTPRPTATPMRILDAPFVLKEKREICDGSVPAGLLQVQVTDENGDPLPGVRITVTWQEGEENFYTGLAPEVSPGYADFRIMPGTIYNLKVGEASDILSGIRLQEECGWKLKFDQNAD